MHSLTPTQEKIQTALKNNTVTPGRYTPTAGIKSSDSLVIMAGDTPLIAMGWSEDLLTHRQSRKLIASSSFISMLQAASIDTRLTLKIISGEQLFTESSYPAIVEKDAGEVVINDNESDGPLVAVVLLNNQKGTALAGALCVQDELAEILSMKAI